jgi:3-oxoacyl-[acyl-carrier-protein] synthase II
VTRRVAITGVGAVTPLAQGAEPSFKRWAEGEVAIEDGGARCNGFSTNGTVSVKERRHTDRCTHLLLGACEEALEQAGLTGGLPYEPEEIGCVVGTGIGGLGSYEKQHDVFREGEAVSPFCIPVMMANAPAGVAAMHYGLTGPNFGVVSACAAGAHAIATAMRLLQAGDAKAVVAGGTESAFTPLIMEAFAKMGAFSPSGVSRPFDVRRDGFVMGEGAGVLVLEDAEAAARRGAPVLGELLSCAATSDAYHLTAPDPGGDGAHRAITLALRRAEVEPDQIDYVNAHGTSTRLNDYTETIALKRALGDEAHAIPVSSFKSAAGHLIGAAGTVEAIMTLYALRHRTVPPTLGYEEPDPELDLDYVPERARSFTPRSSDGSAIAISNSFGFGGHNAVLCMRVES